MSKNKYLETLKTLDAFTWPNAVTLGRLVLSPIVAKRLRNDPKGKWIEAGAFLFSDIIDGFMAKVMGKSPLLSKLGFRKSEFGKMIDPLTDKPVVGQLIKAGIDAEVVPKWLGYTSLAQKIGISAFSMSAGLHGAKIEVTDLGRHSELATNIGVGLLFPAESIEDPSLKRLARGSAMVLAVGGIAGALAANQDYVHSVHEQLAQQPSRH